MKFQPTFKKIFFAVFTLLFLTGSIWWYFEKFVRVHGQFGDDHHPIQEILIRCHGAIAYGFLLVLGYLIHSHIRPGLKSKKKKSLPTGWMMIIATGFLVLSSAMDLFGPENIVREILTQIHRYLGLFFPVLIFIHVKKWKQAKHTHPQS